MVRPLVTTTTSSRSCALEQRVGRSASGRGADVEQHAVCPARRARRPRRRCALLRRRQPTARLLERGLAPGAVDRGTAPPCTRDERPVAASASRSVRTVTSETPSSAPARRPGRSPRRRQPRCGRAELPSSARGVRGRRRHAPSCLRCFHLLRNAKSRLASAGLDYPRARGVRHRAGIVKRATVLADGRELIYFDDADTTLAARARGRRPRARPAARRPRTMRQDVAHRRVGLDRRRPPEPRVPAAGRARPARPGDARRTRPRSPTSTTSPCSRTARRRSAPPARGRRRAARLDDLARARPRPHPHLGRPLRGRLLQPRARRLVRDLTDSRARTVVEAWADRTAALSALPGIAAGLPVREPRRGHRRHPAPPARPDLRLPLRHPAHARACSRRSTRYGPDLFADILDFERAGRARRARRAST